MFPLKARGKTPSTQHGFKDATSDAKQIEAWWRETPRANIGLALPKGWVVIDVDGDEAHQEVKANDFDLPTTPTVHTGRDGGAHYYYDAGDEVIPQSAGKLLPNVDTRIGGLGYTVLPPSVHETGQRYTWHVPLGSLTELPAWVAEKLREPDPGSVKVSTVQGDRSPLDVATIFAGVPHGQRNDRLFRYCARLRRKNLKQAEAEVLVLGAAAACNPPLAQSEAMAVVGNVFRRYEPGENSATKRFLATDYGNAERLVALYGDDLLYCHTWRKWLVWTGKRWEIDERGQAVFHAKATVRSIYADAQAISDEAERKAHIKRALASESARRIKAMLELAQSEIGIPVTPDELDADPWLLNCENGTIDLRTGELREHRREDMVTKLAPVAYEPGAEAPVFKAFLERIMDDDHELLGFVQRWLGYALTGDTGERCMAIFHGGGDNGKSTLLETMLGTLGDYSLTTPTETLLVNRGGGGGSIPNDIARLKGARLVVAAESEEGRRVAESRVKQMTGGDTLSARFMRSEFFDFKPEFKLTLATNHKPLIRGTDHAIWRRIRLVPFAVTIPEIEQDKSLKNKLEAEWPAILAWAVRGCLAWQRDGLQPPGVVADATAGYRGEMDVIGQFLEDRCTVGTGLTTTAGELWAAFGEWCQATGEYQGTQKSFGLKLNERGFERFRYGGKTLYKGIDVGVVHDVHDCVPKKHITNSVGNYVRVSEKSVHNGATVHKREVSDAPDGEIQPIKGEL